MKTRHARGLASPYTIYDPLPSGVINHGLLENPPAIVRGVSREVFHLVWDFPAIAQLIPNLTPNSEWIGMPCALIFR